MRNVECSCCWTPPADGKHPHLMTLKHGGQAGVYPLCEACHLMVEAVARRLAMSGHNFRVRECALIAVMRNREQTLIAGRERVRAAIEPCRLEMAY